MTSKLVKIIQGKQMALPVAKGLFELDEIIWMK